MPPEQCSRCEPAFVNVFTSELGLNTSFTLNLSYLSEYDLWRKAINI